MSINLLPPDLAPRDVIRVRTQPDERLSLPEWVSFQPAEVVQFSGGADTQDSFRAKLRSALGGYSRVLRLYRRLRPTWLWERFNPMGKATHRYVCENGLRVTRGFAKGVVYPDGAAGHVGFLAAKLSGAYEAELEESLLSVADFDVFVDVGSGDGFYCVAAAKKAPGTTIIGFETDNSERAIAGTLGESPTAASPRAWHGGDAVWFE